MPVYLCIPGSNSPEPWRHGIPVYALPFPFESSSQRSKSARLNENENANSNGNQQTEKGIEKDSDMKTYKTSYEDNIVNNLQNHSNSNNDQDQFQMHQYEDDDNRYTTHNLAGAQTSRGADVGGVVAGGSGNPSSTTSTTATSALWNLSAVLSAGRHEPIRRVKHAEVVLVDEVNVYHGNYWLRLRWPGRRGGVAGYIPLGGVNVIPIHEAERIKEGLSKSRGDNYIQLDGSNNKNNDDASDDKPSPVDDGSLNSSSRRKDNAHHLQDGICKVAKSRSYNSDQEASFPEEESDELGLSDPPTELPHQSNSRMMKCESTGYYFPSTEAMKLLPQYDDGLSGLQENMVDDMDNTGNRGEPVFCRICRDGLHDIDYDFEVEGEKKEKNDTNEGATGAATANNTSAILNSVNAHGIQRNFKRHSAVENAAQMPTENDTSEMPYMMQNHLLNNSMQYRNQTNQTKSQSETQQENKVTEESKAPIKAEQRNHPYAENPLLSPCECSGSMAFVHYLCIEQWRCRSNHPDARNGLNCETCKVAYTLPPPPSRPDTEEDEWLEAMPPHVLAALRNPHLSWQIGAAIVRRRWLRPIAPIITSPIVALYCRARRSLKKRGVSRRRWACSLCGRRARWKCVRCLRSYYCSRQCQNVSWHIVHKHVCYKPARFWWSVVVYGFAYVYFIPGVLRYPLIYDLGLGMLWMSFVLMGVIAGGIATIMKREMGTDIRGRTLELSVVVMTLWMAWVGWGLVWSFFGVHGQDQCVGFMNKMSTFQSSIGIPSFRFFHSESKTNHPSIEQRLVQNLLLKPTTAIINSIDKGLLKTPQLVTNWICSPEEANDVVNQSCLLLARKTNPDFMLSGEIAGEKCRSDFNVMSFCFYLAGFIYVLGSVWKRRDRGRRQRHPRPHQD